MRDGSVGRERENNNASNNTKESKQQQTYGSLQVMFVISDETEEDWCVCRFVVLCVCVCL